MKKAKRTLSLVLAVMMVMAVLVIPASAASSEWVGRFQKFAPTKRTSYQTGYAKAVQSILLGYDTYTYDKIYYSGGVDGSFGTNTEAAVKYFQEKEELDIDGSVGPATWGKMAEVMDAFTYVGTTHFWMGGREAIIAEYSGGVYNFSYYDTDGTKGSVFATVY